MAMGRRRKILKAIIKGKVRDAFFRSSYRRLEEVERGSVVGAEVESSPSRITSGSNKEFSRSRSRSGSLSKEFSRTRSSSGSSKYSSSSGSSKYSSSSGSSRYTRSSSSSRHGRNVIVHDSRMLKRSEQISTELNRSRSSSGLSKDFTRSQSGSGSSKYSGSSGSFRLGRGVVVQDSNVLKRCPTINIKTNRLLKRTDSLVPTKFHSVIGVTTPVRSVDALGSRNGAKETTKLQHVDSLIFIRAQFQPGNRPHDTQKAKEEIVRQRSFKRIHSTRSFKRVDSGIAVQPQRRLQRSTKIKRKARQWRTERSVVRFHLGLGKATRGPRDCYLRAMLKAAEAAIDSTEEEASAKAMSRTCKFGPIHVDEIEEEVGFCRDIMLVYHRSVSSLV